MPGINKVIIVGNLGKDPEVRSFQNGGQVCNFSVATSETWKDRNTGEKRERTEWHNISVYGEGLVGICEQYLRKGSKVYLEGKLQTRKWQDRDGNDRYSTDVVLQGFGCKLEMLGRPGGGNQQQNNGGYSSQDSGSGGWDDNNSGGGAFDDDLDDDVPF